MKKTSKTSAIAAAYLGVALVLGCAKKDEEPAPIVNCVTMISDFTKAGNELLANPNKANCENYKKFLRVYVDKCNITDPDYKRDLEEVLAKPCPNQ